MNADCLNEKERLVIPGDIQVVTADVIRDRGSLKQIVLEEGVREIRPDAIISCQNLERIVLPETIQIIGTGNLKHCEKVREIVGPAENGVAPYWALDGVLYRKAGGGKSELLFYPPGKQDAVYCFPDNVRCGYAGEGMPFNNVPALIVLQIPNRWLEGSVARLKQLFDRHTSIREIHIQQETMPEIISSDALALCSSLNLNLTYQINDNSIAVNPSALDFDLLGAEGGGKEIPFARIRAAQSFLDGDKESFVAWACDALKRKKETAILIKMVRQCGADADSLNQIVERFLARIGKNGIKSAEAENYADFCLQCINQLEMQHLSAFCEQCAAKKLDGIVQKLEADPRVKQLLSVCEEDDVNEIEAFVLERYRQTEEIKWLSGFDLSGVKYNDTGVDVPEFVVRYVLAAYSSQLEKLPREIGGYRRDAIELSINKNADRVAACFERTSFLALLNKLSDFGSIEQPDVKAMKLVIAAGRYESDEWIRDLCARCSWWSDWYMYGASGRAAIIAAHGAIMLNDTKAAIAFTDNKLDNLSMYASMRDTSAEVIRNKVLADVGLDENGSRFFAYGNTNVSVSLNGDMKYDIFNVTKNKYVKSFPKDSSDELAWNRAATEFKQLKKETREVIKNQTNTAFSEFLSGRQHKTEEWKSAYLENALLKRFAELLVWKYDNKGHQMHFTLNDGKPIDVNGDDLDLDGGNICVAHPIEIDRPELRGWQKFFLKMHRKQPFEQIWEPVIDMRKFKSSRYAGQMIPYHKFLHREKDGITVNDYDFHNDITISFAGCNAMVVRKDWVRHEIDMNHRFEVESITIPRTTRATNHILAYLDRITVIGRVVADDVSISTILDNFSFAQINEYIKLANENDCNGVLAILMEYKNANFADYDPMDEFILD